MAVLDHNAHGHDDATRCVYTFCAFWLGFFVLIGLGSYLVSMI